MPGTTQHAIHKSTPQLAEECFYPLTQTADEVSRLPVQSSTIFRGDEQHLGFISQHFGQWRTDVSQVAQRNSTVNRECQGRSSVSTIEVGRQQQSATKMSIQVTQQMQLEAEEPAGRRFAPLSTIFSQEPHPSMTDRLADWDGLGVNQIKRRGLTSSGACGLS